MADPSRPPTFAQYGVDRRCYGCGRKLTSKDVRWFTGIPKHAVYGQCCFHRAAKTL